MFKRIGKIFVSFAVGILFIFSLQTVVHSEDIITNRTGTIRIIRPDGIALVVDKDDHIVSIPSGSRVEVLDGSIDVAPAEGFIQIVIGNSVAMVKTGDKITASVDPKTKIGDFNITIGEVSIITANTTAIVRAGQEVQIGLDKWTDTVKLSSIRGDIAIVTAGVRASIMPGGLAWIKVDVQTHRVHIRSLKGMVEVVSVDGERIFLARGESKEVKGSISGEVLTFPFEVTEISGITTEEPVEPEIPEASPYRP